MDYQIHFDLDKLFYLKTMLSNNFLHNYMLHIYRLVQIHLLDKTTSVYKLFAPAKITSLELKFNPRLSPSKIKIFQAMVKIFVPSNTKIHLVHQNTAHLRMSLRVDQYSHNLYQPVKLNVNGGPTN